MIMELEMWSEKEIAFLRENYNHLTHSEIGAHLQKTQSAVRGMCFNLQLSKKHRKDWSDSEIEYLNANHQTYTCAEMAKHLNRTTKSVQHKFRELGLIRHSNKPNSVYIGQTINYLTVLDIPFSVKVGKAQKIKWQVKCACKCGNITTVWLNSLLDNHIKSCGCFKNAVASKRCKERNKKYTNIDIIHHRLYRQWLRIKNDCCSEWLNYENFYNWAIDKYQDKYSALKIDDKDVYSVTNTRFDFVSCRSSLHEKQLKQFLVSHGYAFRKNRKLLGGHEIDLYNADLKLGIEYCGLYWHSEYNNRLRNAHFTKYRLLEEQGIRLITIFSDEWLNRQTQVKNFLLHTLGYNTERIFARKCGVEEISSVEGSKFIEDNHIQGKKQSDYYVGLVFNSNLVGCMSFAKHHRGNNSCIVLDRMCFSHQTSVVGGASKMLNFAIPHLSVAGHTKIMSWSDNRWSQGKVYEKMGFTLDGELGPDYSYIKLSDGKKRISKQSMMKSKTGCPKDKTEKQWAEENGYSRIWDCGKKRWVLHI